MADDLLDAEECLSFMERVKVFLSQIISLVVRIFQ